MASIVCAILFGMFAPSILREVPNIFGVIGITTMILLMIFKKRKTDLRGMMFVFCGIFLGYFLASFQTTDLSTVLDRKSSGVMFFLFGMILNTYLTARHVSHTATNSEPRGGGITTRI